MCSIEFYIKLLCQVMTSNKYVLFATIITTIKSSPNQWICKEALEHISDISWSCHLQAL